MGTDANIHQVSGSPTSVIIPVSFVHLAAQKKTDGPSTTSPASPLLARNPWGKQVDTPPREKKTESRSWGASHTCKGVTRLKIGNGPLRFAFKTSQLVQVQVQESAGFVSDCGSPILEFSGLEALDTAIGAPTNVRASAPDYVPRGFSRTAQAPRLTRTRHSARSPARNF